MPASQARVLTGRASRYLTQLCQHTGRLGALGRHALARRHGHGDGGAAPMPRHTEISGPDGVITLAVPGAAPCTPRAALELSAEAADQQQLRGIQEAITGRRKRIGRRDG